MASKNTALFDAISNATGKAAAKPARGRAPAPAATNDDEPKGKQQASRIGKFNLNSYLDMGFKTSLRAIQVKHPDRQIQDLVAEALNDLFAKYDVPTISDEQPRAARKRA